MSGVQLIHVTKEYDQNRVVDSIDLSIAQGEFMTLLGPSGCGKTTTLRMIAGFVTPSAGSIHIGTRDVTRVAANQRNTGMVFQSFALFPHLTVAENVAFGLKVRKVDRQSARERVRQAINLVRLEGCEDRLPKQMSGGQQQRVALARAVVINPEVLLLDEPLSALDLQLRHELQVYIRHVQQALGVTTIYVTHDQGEALRMSDRIAVMREGRIAQLASPQELYRRPSSAFVAKFIGRANVIDVDVLGVNIRPNCYTVAVTNDSIPQCKMTVDAGDTLLAGPASLVFRPEVARLGHSLPNKVSGKLLKRAYSGSMWSLAVECGKSMTVEIEVPYLETPPDIGQRLDFSFRAEDCHLIPREAA